MPGGRGPGIELGLVRGAQEQRVGKEFHITGRNSIPGIAAIARASVVHTVAIRGTGRLGMALVIPGIHKAAIAVGIHTVVPGLHMTWVHTAIGVVAVGVIGRVSQVSDSAARVILLTDINSRVPVLIESSRTRAIMAGTNSARTKLIHLPQGARVVPSDRIITSGHGGAFPPGLAVGIVASVSESGIRVQPFTNFSKPSRWSSSDMPNWFI